MRRIFTLSLLLWFSLTGWQAAFAQQLDYTSLGFEWIESGQPYIKIKVVRDGIFRVNANRLLSPANVMPIGIETNFLHLYYRGKEVPIYVSANATPNLFEDQDFIEFYGQLNNAEIDQLLYRDPTTGMPDPAQIPNIARSQFSDTSAYFLTWNATPRANEFNYTDYFNDQYGSFPKPPAFIQTSRLDLYEEFVAGGGVYDPFRDQNTDFQTGEGFIGKVFGSTNVYTQNVKTPYPYTDDGQPAEVTARLMGWSSVSIHKTLVTVGSNSQEFSFNNISIADFTFQANVFDLSGAANGTAVKFKAQGDNPDNQRLAAVQIKYPRRFQFDNDQVAAMTLNNTFNSEITLELNGMDVSNSSEAYVYDLTNRKRARGTLTLGAFQVVLPKYSGEAKLWATTSEGMGIISDTGLVVAQPRFSKLSDAGSGAAFVIITHRGLAQSAEAYAQYRSTNSYNRMTAKVVYVDEIYDEFGYGSITPLAIKRFVRAAMNRWNVKPEYIFLWGKSRIIPRPRVLNTLYRGLLCVPTWGKPETDYEYVSNFDPFNRDNTPLLPIGRVNNINEEEGFAYLDKVKEYESTKYARWMKEMVHLGGGNDQSRQNAVRGILEYCEQIYEAQPLNGHVTYSQRSQTNVVGDAPDIVNKRINEGVVGIGIIGDGTPFIADVELLEPNEYINYGKYPFIHSQGCFKGEFSENLNTTGEKWVKEPRRGAIGWLSASGAGFEDPIRRYFFSYYEVGFRDSIHLPIGKIIQNAFKSCVNGAGGAQAILNMCRQSNLQGDPSLKLYSPAKPDLVVEEAGVTFNPTNISADQDSFYVNVRVENIGLAFQDSFKLRLIHTTPAGDLRTYIQTCPPIDTAQTFAFKIKRGDDRLSGLNVFDVFADYQDSIPEIEDTLNNHVRFERFINIYSPAIIYPWEFAIVNKSRITLQAATFGVVRDSTIRYEFEIDTVYEFNSPLRQTAIVTGTSVEAKWELPFELKVSPSNYTNTTTYYWRVRLPDQGNPAWANASFKYMVSPVEGWAQAREPQFFENPTVNVKMDKLQRDWKFEPFARSLSIISNGTSGFKTRMYSNGAQIHLLDDINSANAKGLFYCIFDGKSLAPLTYEVELGNAAWIRVPSMLTNLTDIINQMKTGDYMVIMSNTASVAQWTPEFYLALQQIGVTSAVKNSGYDNFVFLGRKGGALGSAQEVLTPNSGVSFILKTVLYSTKTNGVVNTRVAGPAKEWRTYYWDWKSLESSNVDKISTSIIGVKFDGTETVLFNNVPAKQEIDLSSGAYRVDPTLYPRLKLRAYLADSVLRTAPQLDNWHLLYSPVPEACIDPFINFAFNKDTLNEGDTLLLRLAARNLTELDMDSLLVRYEIRPVGGNRTVLSEGFREPLLGTIKFPKDRFPLELKLPTLGYKGVNEIIVTINPDYQQPERYLFNNVYYQRVYINEDKLNPLLDVTFDGKRIIDGDIVSPKPEIKILVNDENQYLILNDPSKIKIAFKNLDERPDPLSADVISINDPRLQFIPATLPDNKATLIFKPGMNDALKDGEYVLEVQSADIKGNQSGPLKGTTDGKPYRIRFEVINESAITDVLNYPNPFSTSTRFVYTLTGGELPEIFQIHVYTISGKFVKKIDLRGMGDVAIGQNITNYSWDATDEFGERLANGVYLYKTIIKMPGDGTIKKIDKNTDQYFKAGWGKMYIMR